MSNRQTMAVNIAEGFRVHIDRLIIEDRRLVYLSMLGDKTSLDASWAFIKNRPRRLISIGNYTIKTEKKEHYLFKSPELPSGGHHWIMVNRRASWLTLKPNDEFYLLNFERDNYYHNTRQTCPPHFYTLLNQTLTIPILPEWTQYLWRKANITSIDKDVYLADSVDSYAEGNVCYNSRAWKIFTDFDEWSDIIKLGIRYGDLTF